MILLTPLAKKLDYGNIERYISVFINDKLRLEEFLLDIEILSEDDPNLDYLFIPIFLLVEDQYFKIKTNFPLTKSNFNYLITQYLFTRVIYNYEICIGSFNDYFYYFHSDEFRYKGNHIKSPKLLISTADSGETIITGILYNTWCPLCGHICGDKNGIYRCFK